MITYIIIGVTAIISYLCFSRRDLFFKLSMYPSCIIENREYYRLISHVLVHGDWAHLIFNMLTLYFFGPYVERVFIAEGFKTGAMLYLLLYVAGAIISSLYSLYRYRKDHQYLAVGASGAVSAILFSFILIEPTQPLSLFLLPIPIPAFLFGALYLGVSFYLARKKADHIGHDAHFWGAVFGFLYTLMCFPQFLDNFVFKIQMYF